MAIELKTYRVKKGRSLNHNGVTVTEGGDVVLSDLQAADPEIAKAIEPVPEAPVVIREEAPPHAGKTTPIPSDGKIHGE